MIVFDFFIYSVDYFFSSFLGKGLFEREKDGKATYAIVVLIVTLCTNFYCIFNNFLKDHFSTLLLICICLIPVFYYMFLRNDRYQRIRERFEKIKNRKLIILGHILVLLYIGVSLYFLSIYRNV